MIPSLDEVVVAVRFRWHHTFDVDAEVQLASILKLWWYSHLSFVFSTAEDKISVSVFENFTECLSYVRRPLRYK